jgi:hypothetical protein
MAGGIEKRPDDGWGDWLGHKTFIYTTIGAALFVAAVFIFIL